MSKKLSSPWRMYGRATAFVLAVLFAVGTAGHAHEASLPLMLRLTPWFSLLTGLAVVAPALAASSWRFPAWVAGTYGFTFVAEAAGVATGMVFGTYEYGPTMGAAWLGVPLVIAFNWAVVVHGCVCIACRVVPRTFGNRRKGAIVLLAAAGAVAFDWVMEPAAIRLDYWTWVGGDIPLQNYVAWFAIAALAAPFHPRVLRQARDLGTEGRLAAFFVAAQVAFFAALRLALA
jgi:bisanhydrobacterioruberin hydratase